MQWFFSLIITKLSVVRAYSQWRYEGRRFSLVALVSYSLPFARPLSLPNYIWNYAFVFAAHYKTELSFKKCISACFFFCFFFNADALCPKMEAVALVISMATTNFYSLVYIRSVLYVEWRVNLCILPHTKWIKKNRMKLNEPCWEKKVWIPLILLVSFRFFWSCFIFCYIFGLMYGYKWIFFLMVLYITTYCRYIYLHGWCSKVSLLLKYAPHSPPQSETESWYLFPSQFVQKRRKNYNVVFFLKYANGGCEGERARWIVLIIWHIN